MSDTIKVTEPVKGVLMEQGVQVSKDSLTRFFQPLVGKTIKNVLLQKDPEGGYDPEIILNFTDGSAAAILQDAEGNGPGFIDYIRP